MNLCIFIGRLTAEPELRTTQNGDSVAHFTIAVPRSRQEADFIDIEAWKQTADFAGKWIHKGMRVAVCGGLHQHKYTDRQGIDRKAYTLTAERLEFADAHESQPAE